MLRRLCHRLQAKGALSASAGGSPAALRFTKSTLAGLIPPDGILSISEPATLRTIKENKKASSFDSLDKALVVFRHPANGTTRKRDIYRRVDLIFARWPSFGAAVLGWSGSTQFERDLRKHAEKLCVQEPFPEIDPAIGLGNTCMCLTLTSRLQRLQVRLGWTPRSRHE